MAWFALVVFIAPGVLVPMEGRREAPLSSLRLSPLRSSLRSSLLPRREGLSIATALKTADGKKSTLLAARRVTVTEGRYVGPGCLSNHRLQVSCPLIFVLIMAVWVVCGCIFTRKPRKKLPAETARPAVLQERQPGCFALEEERGGHWTASSVPVIKEARPSL
jgi:hypothetical protein